mmetsp:Transcript_28712/g.71540  ORF Transcript_28712/g.71540 Transcript_28712/m.71540 type:complete len:208 (-) Transcript_28712:168-791(-)
MSSLSLSQSSQSISLRVPVRASLSELLGSEGSSALSSIVSGGRCGCTAGSSAACEASVASDAPSSQSDAPSASPSPCARTASLSSCVQRASLSACATSVSRAPSTPPSSRTDGACRFSSCNLASSGSNSSCSSTHSSMVASPCAAAASAASICSSRDKVRRFLPSAERGLAVGVTPPGGAAGSTHGAATGEVLQGEAAYDACGVVAK